MLTQFPRGTREYQVLLRFRRSWCAFSSYRMTTVVLGLTLISLFVRSWLTPG